MPPFPREEQQSFLLVANFPSDAGYAWWLMESFWVRLAERYHPTFDVILAYPRITSLPPSIRDAPIRVAEFSFREKGLRAFLDQCRFLRMHQVQAMYLSDWPTRSWRYIAYRLCGVRLIINHDHTPGLRTVPTGIKRTLKRLLHRIPGLSVDGAIGATGFVQRRLNEVARLPAEKCFAAPNGLPTRNDRPDAADLRRMFDIHEGRVIAIMTGRAHPYKRVDFVLECLSALQSAEGPGLHFVFVGDGPVLDDLKHTAHEKGIRDRCTFAGRRDDVFSLLLGADLAIHPSRGEVGYSLSILEYMDAGLPVVVPDNPSVCGATVHGETGLIFPEGNVEAAAGALQRLIENPDERRRLGDNARRAAKSFDLKRTHECLLRSVEAIDTRGWLRGGKWRS